MNEMDEKKFGARCCRKTWKKPPPMQREASTYSLLRSLRKMCIRDSPRAPHITPPIGGERHG